MVTSYPDRRAFCLAASGVISALAVPGRASELAVKPRQRVIIDNDFSGDPDGLFQLAHHLLSPSVEIPFVIGSHIHVGDFLDPSDHQGVDAAGKAKEVASRLRLRQKPIIVAGRNQAPEAGAKPMMTTVTRMIIDEAMRDSPTPLVYAAGAGLTELAEALRLAPEIAKRMTLIWIGGGEYADLLAGGQARSNAEYNLTIDLQAARAVFNESAIEIWQVPRNTYRQMLISNAELVSGLAPAGALGDYLLAQVGRVIDLLGRSIGETYILGDSPLVTLTALQSSFDTDSSSSQYVVRPTPRLDSDGRYVFVSDGRPMRVYTTIDARLTFSDMFAKFRVSG